MYLIIKRIIDIVLSLVALIIISPLMLPICLLLRLTAEGEVFYFQDRMGQNNQPFKIWKFATMLKNSPNLGTGTITLRNDPRVTPIGRFLRRSKINELPQLINILIGDMSIVGPRPLMPKDFHHYPERVQAKIYQSKPGITGIGSIVFRDEQDFVSRSSIPPVEFYKRFIIPYKGELELWYNEHASTWTDFAIIFLTAWNILFSKSELVFKVFPSLPARPEELNPKSVGIIQVSSSGN